ncbi:hypothetical protein ACW7CJ_17555, partial [Klebsiella pneumoniae]
THVEFRDYSCCCYFVSSRIRNPMVKKSLRQFTLMATATVTLLLGLMLAARRAPAREPDGSSGSHSLAELTQGCD